MPAARTTRRHRGTSLGVALAMATAAALLAATGPAAVADPEPDDGLARAARVNGLSEDRLRSMLAEDPTLGVGAGGRLLYADPPPSEPAGPALVAQPVAALADTFDLHSNPGAALEIVLDFDGAHVAGTYWNRPDPEGNVLPEGTHPAWDPAGDGPTFSPVERAMVQEIWQRVAEDYAAFDVDVTTEQPTAEPGGAPAAGEKPRAWALMTPSAVAHQRTCNEQCGGIAYINAFGDREAEPAWVFTHALDDHPAFIAEAASHELGHNLGLGHDGRGASPYYTGHDNDLWGPVMGAPYYSAVTQWSLGEYSGAILGPGQPKGPDDVAIIRDTLTTRPDEAGSTTATAVPIGAGHGYITARNDADTYQLGTCTGTVDLAAATVGTGADLDIRLELLDADGTVVASADPAASVADFNVASGLAAALSAEVTSGTYLARVDGVGVGTPDDGYTDYASLGEYTVTVDGCAPPLPPVAASAPRSVVATAAADAPEITLTWEPPADDGGSPVTEYRVSRTGRAPVDVSADARSYTFSGLEPNTSYELTVAAVTAAGPGAPASAQATTVDVAASAPTAARNLATAWTAATRTVTLTWAPPLDDGGSPVTGFDVALDGSYLGTAPGDAAGVTIPGVRPGRHTYTVRAVNAVGPAPVASVVHTAPAYVTRTSLKAPGRAKVRTRPTVRVTVTPVGTADPATGRVRFTVGKRVVATRTLAGGRASYRLPAVKPRPARLKVTAAYLPASGFARSAAAKVIRIVR